MLTSALRQPRDITTVDKKYTSLFIFIYLFFCIRLTENNRCIGGRVVKGGPEVVGGRKESRGENESGIHSQNDYQLYPK